MYLFVSWFFSVTLTGSVIAAFPPHPGRTVQGYDSFRSAAENKMAFNITIIHHDLLLFSTHDAKVDTYTKSFGVASYITFQEAHSYLLLREIFKDMCARGGKEFRRVMFELDGFTCVGFLHEMFVAGSEKM